MCFNPEFLSREVAEIAKDEMGFGTERDATQETFQWESYTIGLSLAELNYTESFFRTLNRGCISFQELRDSGPAG